MGFDVIVVAGVGVLVMDFEGIEWQLGETNDGVGARQDAVAAAKEQQDFAKYGDSQSRWNSC